MRRIDLLTQTHVVPLEKFPESDRLEMADESKRTEKFDYGEIIEAVILNSDHSRTGISYQDIKLCDGINAALEKARAEAVNGNAPILLLEEAHYEYMKNKIEAYPWRRWTRFTSTFIDHILGASPVEVTPSPPSET